MYIRNVCVHLHKYMISKHARLQSEQLLGCSKKDNKMGVGVVFYHAWE
jgi:hypothetical protein